MEKSKVHVKIKLGGLHIMKFDELIVKKEKHTEFQHIVEQEAVEYHFQPIFSAGNGHVYAYEALMRVNQPLFRSPDAVITYAREHNRLQDVEKLTFFKATETYRGLYWQGLVDDNAYLFVNSIGNVCLEKTDSDRYYKEFRDIKDKIVVEITETEDIREDYLDTKRKSKGFSGMFALDDYGSGHGTASALLVLQPRYIKIDMSLIKGIDKDSYKQRIVENVVSFAHKQDTLVIAEGIETVGELLTVLDMGADLLQGFYLARPEAVPSEINPAALDVIRRYHYTEKMAMS
jgi:EAL domain-containing protein (putative c-di-GMP-specific phosphodiesterase class I)